MSDRKKRLDPERAEIGRKKAVEVQRDMEMSYKDKVNAVMEASGCSESAAKTWLRKATKKILADDSQIASGDMEGSRWSRLQNWDQRSRIYRQLAGVEISKEKTSSAVRLEGISIKYEELIARSCHWFSLPPERDLEESEVRTLILGALARQLHHLNREEVIKLRGQLDEELVRRDEEHERATDSEDGDLASKI